MLDSTVPLRWHCSAETAGYPSGFRQVSNEFTRIGVHLRLHLISSSSALATNKPDFSSPSGVRMVFHPWRELKRTFGAVACSVYTQKSLPDPSSAIAVVGGDPHNTTLEKGSDLRSVCVVRMSREEKNPNACQTLETTTTSSPIRPADSKQARVEAGEDEGREPMHASGAESDKRRNGGQTRMFVFVYGTLKRGFGNERLMKEMMAEGRASYEGKGRSKERYPLVIGPYQVPFLLDMRGFGEHVWGEVYSVDGAALQRLDRLEGTSHGHYVRKSVSVLREGIEMEAWAYFAGSSYAGEMWTKTGPHKCVPLYSKQHAVSYVKRNDRPPNLSFLQHIQVFLTAISPPSCLS